jgi:serine/threonine protein kinase
VSHLPSAKGAELCQLRGETQVARVIAGIVLAMRYLHSRRVIHCNLTPDNILLDWDWNVCIGDFGHSLSLAQPTIPPSHDRFRRESLAFVESHNLAPECYENRFYQESDVFSFGVIPEILAATDSRKAARRG